MFAPFALLTAALAALWLDPAARDPRGGAGTRESPPGRRFAWLALLVSAYGVGAVQGIVSPLGALWLLLFAGALRLHAQPAIAPRLRMLAVVMIVVGSTAFFVHLLPGFVNPLAIPRQQITPDALPFRLHLNFDKAAAGLLLFALLHERATTLGAWRAVLRATLPVAAATVFTLMALALLAGYVRPDLKFPPVAWIFLWANLCFTCVAEEALFRGFVQAGLARRWREHRHGALAALAGAAVLFGLAHAAGGPTYVVLSTLAGLGYGAAYLHSGYRLEAAILTHWTVNAVHFVGFTYPALQRT